MCSAGSPNEDRIDGREGRAKLRTVKARGMDWRRLPEVSVTAPRYSPGAASPGTCTVIQSGRFSPPGAENGPSHGGRGSGHQPGLAAVSVGMVTRTYSTSLMEAEDAGKTAPPGPARSETATRRSSSLAAGRRTSRNGSNSFRAAAMEMPGLLAAGKGSSRMTLYAPSAHHSGPNGPSGRR